MMLSDLMSRCTIPASCALAKTVRDLDRDLDRALHVQLACGDQVGHRAAVDQLHDHEGHAVDLVHVVDLRDRGVHDRSGRARFLQEAAATVGVGR